MENLILNRLAPISNLKNKKAKGSYALFYLPFFILRPISLNEGFSFFTDHFEHLGNFFLVSLKQKK